jgi:purine nucleosidase
LTQPIRPVLFDTDIGSDVDDALALALLLAAPEALELVAVTTVGRGGPVRARVAASLLGLAGRAEVEVCIGEERPLLRPQHAFNWFDHEERCVAQAPLARISDERAPERIARAACEVPGLELVAVGPMTNLARALALDPELPRRVAGLTIMGGHLREARIGAFTCAPGIDYNLCSDPEASVAVLGAGFRTTLVPADVTLQTWMVERDRERLAGGGPLARELARQVGLWAPLQRRLFTGMGGSLDADNVAFLHDPLTVLSLVDAAPLRFEELRIVVTLERATLRTFEVARELGLGAPMRVATSVDARAAGASIVDRLLRA